MPDHIQDEIGADDLVEQVRQYVSSAANILRGLGPDQERIGWILEDALMYLDELGGPLEDWSISDIKLAN